MSGQVPSTVPHCDWFLPSPAFCSHLSSHIHMDLHRWYPNLWEWHLCPVDIQDCIKVVFPEERLMDPHHQEEQGEEGPVGHHMNPYDGDIFLLNHSLALTLSLPPSSPHFFPSIYLTFIVK